MSSVEDGLGSCWEKCLFSECGLHVVRPGKAQCDCEGPTPLAQARGQWAMLEVQRMRLMVAVAREGRDDAGNQARASVQREMATLRARVTQLTAQLKQFEELAISYEAMDKDENAHLADELTTGQIAAAEAIRQILTPDA